MKVVPTITNQHLAHAMQRNKKPMSGKNIDFAMTVLKITMAVYIGLTAIGIGAIIAIFA